MVAADLQLRFQFVYALGQGPDAKQDSVYANVGRPY